MMLYIASEKELPRLGPWSAGMDLSVEALLSIDDEPVRRQLGAGHLYYLGSDQGCGCGFNAEIDAATGHPHRRQSSRSRTALQAYLTEHLPKSTVVRLFSCWDGDQSLPIEFQDRITTHDLVTSAWRYREHELLELVVT